MPLNARCHSRLCEPNALCAAPHRRGLRRAGAGCWAMALLALLAAAALAPAVRAQTAGTTGRPGVAYFGTPRIINVGILRLGSAGQLTPPTSIAANTLYDQYRGAYLFTVLNNRPDILPNVWTLKNPNAPSHVDAQTTARFPNFYNQDAPVTQNMAPYWEISGDTITTTLGLSAYDLIVITTSNTIAFNLEQRRAIRQFIDKGGTLWVDTASMGENATQLAALLDQSLIFHAAIGGTPCTSTATSANDLSHPLATGYYTLSSNDLDSLGSGVVGSHQILSGVTSDIGKSPDPSLFHAVNTFTGAASPSFGSIAAANYGNGHILITDRGIPDAISNGPNVNATNSQSGTNFLAAPAADLKFVVNVLAWASNADGPGGGGRADNAQPGALAGAVQSNWTFPTTGQALTGSFNPQGTATYGNRLFVTAADGYVRAFDINPGESLAYGLDFATNGDDYYSTMPNGPVTTDTLTSVPMNADYSNGYPYDEIWTDQVSDRVSAPSVAEIPVGQTGGAPVNTPVVLVEAENGSVTPYDAVNGTAYPVLAGDGKGSFGPGALIPAPTYYRGRVYATQADGSVQVSSPGSTIPAFTIPVVVAGPGATPSLSSPAVQSIPGADMKGYNGEDVVGYLYDTAGSPTSNIYALFLGSRDEHFSYIAYNGTTPPPASSYQTLEQSLQSLSGLSVYGAPEDTDDTAGGQDWLFDFPGGNDAPAVKQTQSAALPTTTNMVQSIGPPIDMFGDYELEPNAMVMGSPRTTVNANLAASNAQTASIQGIAVSSVSQGIAASLSNESTAFNTANNFYVTVNEPNNANPTTGYIMSVKERSPAVAQSFIAWRFALVGGVTDAEGVTYDFAGYQFKGAPVCDGNGYVYALAFNPTTKTTRLMAFFSNAVCGFSTPFTATTVTQTDELGNTESIVPSQYANTTFKNFSALGSGNLQPDLTMPLPLSVMGANPNGGPATTAVVPASTAQGAQPLLAWWVQLPVSVAGVATAPSVIPTSPLRKIGNTLYFGGQETTTGAANPEYALYGVYADPLGIGLQPDPTTRQIDSDDYRLVQVTPSGVGPISLPPAGFGKYVVTAAGPYTPQGAASMVSGGIEGFGYTPTLITDNHRLVEMDPSGNATWVVDSTREPTTQQIAGMIPALPNPPPSMPIKTIVPLNRPTSLTQFSTDDYLLADTGNNRVVHIGRIGDVLTEMPDKYGHTLMCESTANVAALAPNPDALEITGFSDPGGLLAPGAPQTLNQPSNVTFWLTYDLDPSVAGNTPRVIVAHYLICDTGNSRIVEVDDTYTHDTANALGGTSSITYDFAQDQDYHQLAWVTKTTENKHVYKYVSAQAVFGQATAIGVMPAYTPLVNGPLAVVAAVSNARVAALTAASALSAPGEDTQGSAVLALNYLPLSGANPTPYTALTTDGLPFVVINSVQADGVAAGTPPAATTVNYPLRGLRSIQVYGYTPAQAATAGPPATPQTYTKFGLVIADDDGVFDGTYDDSKLATVGPLLDATTADGGWTFRQDAQPAVAEDDYTPIVNEYDAILDVKNDQPLAGAGVSANDYQGTSFSPASALRLANNNYLIVNRGGSGNPNGVPAFPATGETGADFGGNVFVVRAKPGAGGLRANGGTLGGVIFGKPANTGPLNGPSFALRSN